MGDFRKGLQKSCKSYQANEGYLRFRLQKEVIMARDLTKKQKGFVDDYVKTGNATQSALDNYDIEASDKENTAGSIGSENLTKPKIQEAIKSIADQIPDSLLVERHLELLNKRDLIPNTPDTVAVSKGLDMAYKIKGSYAPEERTVNVRVEKLDEIQKATKDILNG